MTVRILWQWKPFWFSGLAWWPHTQRTELFCQSFSLVLKLTWVKILEIRLVQGGRLTKMPELSCYHRT